MSEPIKHQYTIDISWSALLKVVALAVGLYLVTVLREILIMLFVVFIFVAAVNPTIVLLQKRLSRTLAVTLFYVILLAVLLLLGVLVLPALFIQSQQLAREAPGLIQHLTLLSAQHPSSWVTKLSASLTALVSGLPTNLVKTTYNLLGGVAITASGIALSIYLLLEERNAKEFFHQILPQNRYQSVYLTVSKISSQMGSWVRSELILMLIVGVSSLLVYLAFQLPSSLALGLWTGLCEAVPVIGPLLGVLPAFIIGLSVFGWLKTVFLLVIYTLCVQQLEAHIIVPRLMSKALGLSPVLVIVALLVGSRLFGVVGVLVAVPTAAAISVVVGEWSSLRRIWETSTDV